MSTHATMPATIPAGEAAPAPSGENTEPSMVIDVKDGESDPEAERVCRICHLSPDRKFCTGGGGGSGGGCGAEGSELMQIGCGCRGELGIAHRHCAEAWFRVKGNRCCEICGSNAKNITGVDDSNFMAHWHEHRPPRSNTGQRSTSDSCSWLRGQPFCNFLMACLVIAFILPWFFRINFI